MGSLRHTMLRMAGAPEKEQDIVGKIVLETGTLWHKRVAEMLVGTTFMQEVKLTQWLPDGWGGTADWLFWHPEYEAFVLGDLKTTTGEGIPFIEREGIKHEHLHQLSAYWYACVAAGLPMVRGFAVLYLPKNRAKNTKTEPLLVEAEPLDKKYMQSIMQDRRALVDSYLASIRRQRNLAANSSPSRPVSLITDALAEPMERVLKTAWNADKWEVKLVPHWSAQFCPYDDELCDCDKQGETKIGEYKSLKTYDDEFEHAYFPRKGYEDTLPPELTEPQRRRLIESSS